MVVYSNVTFFLGWVRCPTILIGVTREKRYIGVTSHATTSLAAPDTVGIVATLTTEL